MPLEIKGFKGRALLMSVNCCDSQGGLPPQSLLLLFFSISYTSSSPFPDLFHTLCFHGSSKFCSIFGYRSSFISLFTLLFSIFAFSITLTPVSILKPFEAERKARNYTSNRQRAILSLSLFFFLPTYQIKPSFEMIMSIIEKYCSPSVTALNAAAASTSQ